MNPFHDPTVIHPRKGIEVHMPDIEAINKFFEHGFKTLAEMEQSTSPHKEKNLKIFRNVLGDAWIEAAKSISRPLITTKD